MVTQWFMAWIIGLTGLLLTGSGALGATTAQSWYESLELKEPARGAFVHRILIVKDIREGHLVSLDVDSEKFTEGTYFDLVEGREMEAVSRLNRRGGSTQDYQPMGSKPEELFAAAFRFTHVDTIIYASPESEHWIFYRPDPQLGAKKEFMIKGPEQKDAQSVKKWLIEKLGYNGVLLAQQDSLFLVATYSDAAGSQSAMLVKESDGLLRIKKSQGGGSALLKRRDCYRDMCVFEVVIKTTEDYPVGTKVFF